MVKIKLAIVENDEQYLNRFANYLMLHYGDQFEIVQFTEWEYFEQYTANNNLHCAVICEKFAAEKTIVESESVIVLKSGTELSDKSQGKSVLKYQNVENIINEIKLISADQMGKTFDGETKADMPIYLFEDAIGGAGTTTIAVAFSRYLAYKGKNVLYLNMEQVGDISCFFPQDTQGSFSEVIYQLKAQKGNIQLKIDGLTKVDSIGVNYILPCAKSIDLLSFTENDWEFLVDTLKVMNKFDCVVIDKNFGLQGLDNIIRRFAYRIVYVTNGKPIQERKLERVEAALAMLDGMEKKNIGEKACKILNRCNVSSVKDLYETKIPTILGFQEVHRNDANLVAEDLAHKEGFSSLE